jgi:hypothetical protein
MFLCCGDRSVEVVGGSDDPIAWIIFDQILKRRRQLDIVLDDQDLQHRARLPSNPRKILVLERDGA